ncbi:MAG: hypothetical protein ACKVS5_03315 [Parvularculaceae bacterium]
MTLAARNAFVCALIAAISAACARSGPAPLAAPAAANAVSFVVIGDTPYSAADEAMLDTALPLIRKGGFPFVIHVGDYKGGKQPCGPDHDDRFAALIETLAPMPVFYTPGDNEWTDCDRNKDNATGKPVSELIRLDLIRTRFFAALPHTPAAFTFERQAAQVENATWRHGGVRFATLHVVGTANGRAWVAGDALSAASAAVDARDRANLVWLDYVGALSVEEDASALVIAMQADPVEDAKAAQGVRCDGVSDKYWRCDAFASLRTALRALAGTFGKPILVIHGDTAPFTLNQDFAGDEASNLWRLNAAGDAGIGATGLPYGIRDVTRVTISPGAAPPFSASGLMTDKSPKQR